MKPKIIFVWGFVFAFSGPVFSQVTPGSIIEEKIDNYLSTPAENYIKEIPVVILRSLPTTDGVNIDVSQATDYYELGNITINDLMENIDSYDKRVKFSLEEGSKFHGYKDLNASPYLGYKIIKYLTIYRQIQISNFEIGTDGGKKQYQPDYKKEFEELGITNLIKEKQVKEVWIWYGEAARPGWPSYNPALHGNIQKYVSFVESNMSSPTTDDISNSYRYQNDLPISDHTYVVYCYNFRRTQAEAVHDHGHQLESILGYVNEKQDGNDNLFKQSFMGGWSWPPNPSMRLGSAGSTHCPPNTKTDYDYLNTTLVASDIEDWKPDGGATKLVNVDTWGNLKYNWPGKIEFSQKKESQWYIYWMQNMPGFQNYIPYGAFRMTNWWAFTADWDSSLRSYIGLYEPSTGLPTSVTKKFSIYPNPTHENILVQSSHIPARLYLYKSDGKLVKIYLIENHVSNLSLEGISPNIYLFKIQSDKELFTQKISVQ